MSYPAYCSRSISLGFDTPSIDVQNESRRQQLQKIQKMEDKQLRILYGVCVLFVVCHTCRIFRYFEDLYQKLANVIVQLPCNEGCASLLSLSTHVSLKTIFDCINLLILKLE